MVLSSKDIGWLYLQAQQNQQASIQCLHQCGCALKEVKASVPHGEWLLWLKEHQPTLGFGIRTADRLMKMANSTLTSNLTDEEAVTLSRQVWGNTAEVLPAQPNPFSSHYRRIEGFVEWAAKHPVADLPESELIELRPRIEALRLWIAELDGKAKRLNLRIAS